MPRVRATKTMLGQRDDQYQVLAEWLGAVTAEATAAADLLDIGAGDGDDAYTSLVRPLVGRITGVDPDPSAAANPTLDELYAGTVEEFAADRAPDSAHFDVALAVYVVEHVAEPVGFFESARSLLVPGGSLFVVTPNLWHYFGVLAKATMALRIDDTVLAALRKQKFGHEGHGHNGHGAGGHGAGGHVAAGHGHHHSDAAHFPVSYRANSIAALERLAGEAGFSSLELKVLENPAVFETYFPGRTVAFPRLYSGAVHRLGKPALFGTLIARLVN